MQYESVECQAPTFDIGVYECEIHLKFRLIEEKDALSDREQLLDLLLDAFADGEDEYVESTLVRVEAHEISETQASAQMRRRLIRLRNSRDLK